MKKQYCIGTEKREPVVSRHPNPHLIKLEEEKDEARLGDMKILISANCPKRQEYADTPRLVQAYNIFKGKLSAIRP